jgi:hypothetical protein
MSFPDYIISVNDQRFNDVLASWAERMVIALQPTHPLNHTYAISLEFQVANPFLTDDYYDRVRRDILYILKKLPLINRPTVTFLAYDSNEISVELLSIICERFLNRTKHKSVSLEVQSAFFLTAMTDPTLLDYRIPAINIIAITA